MRNYQILTLIGSLLGMGIAVVFYITMTGFDAFMSSMEESGYGSDVSASHERASNMAYINGAVPFAILLEMGALVIVFAATKKHHQKIVGVSLIVISVFVLIATSWYGILPFALLLPAGILAIKYKQTSLEIQEEEDKHLGASLYRSNGSPIR